MDPDRFDALTRSLPAGGSRRRMLAGALGLLAVLAGHDAGARKKKGTRRTTRKSKPCRNCCRANGNPCPRKNAACKPALCSRFTVTASWDSDENHDSYLFVPNDEGESLPAPFIDKSCNGCVRDLYPFACVNQDAEGPGDEVTSIFKLLSDDYEYWLELGRGAPAGDVVVTLRDRGKLVLTSTSPANPSGEAGVGSWHVFDLDGSTGRFTEIDEVVADNLPRAKTSQNTFVFCP